MNIFKFVFILLISTTINAQVNVININKNPEGTPFFDGNMSPSDIAYEVYGEKLQSEEGSLKVEVSIPIVKNKTVIAQDVSGLPMLNNNGELADDSRINIPFHFDNNLKNTESQSINDFLNGMDSVLQNLKATTEEGIKSGGGCGGFPLGSTITHTWTSYPLCTQIRTTYTCQTHGQFTNWYVTDSRVSSLRPCYIEP